MSDRFVILSPARARMHIGREQVFEQKPKKRRGKEKLSTRFQEIVEISPPRRINHRRNKAVRTCRYSSSVLLLPFHRGRILLRSFYFEFYYLHRSMEREGCYSPLVRANLFRHYSLTREEPRGRATKPRNIYKLLLSSEQK